MIGGGMIQAPGTTRLLTETYVTKKYNYLWV